MYTCITNGIKISVATQYEARHSNTKENRHVFSYNIDIVNESDFTVQLIRRHWYITDSNCNRREVKGDGVVGEQPILRPGERHNYTSWCPFNSEIGIMKGFFTMLREINGEMIEVRVPDFTMCALPRLN